MDADVSQWFRDTQEMAEQLGLKYDMKTRYFMDVFFQGGARMVHHQEEVNPYSAFKHAKALENEQSIFYFFACIYIFVLANQVIFQMESKRTSMSCTTTTTASI